MLLPKLSESLAGRMEVLTLWPFSQGEIHGVRESFVGTLFSRQPVGWTGKTATVQRDELLETRSCRWLSPCGGPPERSAPRRLVSVLRHDDASAGYPRSGQYRRRDGRPTPALGGGCTRWRFAEFRRSVAIRRPAADDIETLLRPAGRDFPGSTATPLGAKSGQTGHSNSEGLPEQIGR